MTARELMLMPLPLMRLTPATWLLNQSNSIHMNRRAGPSQTLWVYPPMSSENLTIFISHL
jgi:hypothetical protein